MKMFQVRLIFPWSFVPEGPIKNIPALVQIIIRNNDDQITDAYASLGLNQLT